MTDQAISPLRRRMIEDMTIRKLAPKTQQYHPVVVARDQRLVNAKHRLRFGTGQRPNFTPAGLLCDGWCAFFR
jgi:hypothetical protein